MKLRLLAAIPTLVVFTAMPVRAQSAIAQKLKAEIALLEGSGNLHIAGQTVRISPVLRTVYARTGFQPLWSDSSALQLVRILRAVDEDGLRPEHYFIDALRELAARGGVNAAAELDLLRTEAFIRVAYDLRRGKVDGIKSAAWPDYSGQLLSSDPANDVIRLIQSRSLADEVRVLRPNHFVYHGLVQALARLRSIQRAGGWPTIPVGPALRPDSTDERVPLLRHRLMIEGDLSSGAPINRTLVFDAELQHALKRYQHRHGLNPDAVLGPSTLAQLNLPVTARIDQVRLNLERARWVTQDLPASFIAVNVAGAMVYFVEDGNVVFETRAVVGKTYTATPVFRATLQSIELNPTWTVPPGIVGEVLREIRRNPAYLREQNIRVFTRGGTEVDRARIDYASYTGRSFPYVFRQEPGVRNPLGTIKLIFPNRYNVYLHDTPSRSLFDREQRAFSHGCIRVQDPIRLAELVLNDSVRWSETALRREIGKGVLHRIPLSRQLPVLILYWTASADLHGELHFYRDVYGRDARLLRALDSR
ncbi:MAG: L,D-transpeptidase family protein [Gemmatimonadota bacterium]